MDNIKQLSDFFVNLQTMTRCIQPISQKIMHPSKPQMLILFRKQQLNVNVQGMEECSETVKLLKNFYHYDDIMCLSVNK